jgi:hypothetical protein
MNVNGYEIKPGANLKGANLEDADLRSANLKGANLTGTILEKKIEFMIEALKEWLPDEHDMIVEERDLGWNDAIKNIKENLK